LVVGLVVELVIVEMVELAGVDEAIDLLSQIFL